MTAFFVISLNTTLSTSLSFKSFFSFKYSFTCQALPIYAERSAALYADLGQSEEMSGGAAANTAVGVAALGGKAAFAGRVHDDLLGHTFCDGPMLLTQRPHRCAY